MNRIFCRALGSALAIAMIALAVARAPAIANDDMIEISPINVTGGAQASHGTCPCFRWSVDVQVASGEWETKHFLISTDALYELALKYGMMDGELSSELHTVGAVEALWKGGHIGLGFQGVTFGDDLDKGYTDILRTGLYVLANIVRIDSLRFDIRTGYQFEQKRVNFTTDDVEHVLPTSLVLDWQSGAWSGDVQATIGVNLTDPGWDTLQYSASATVEARVLRLSDLEAALGLKLGVEYEPDRLDFGMEPLGYTGMLYMRLGWVSRFEGGVHQ